MPERELQIKIAEQPPALYPDVIIVHGSGLHSSEKTELGYKSSWDARMRLTAAGDLWQRHRDKGRGIKVMVVGGNNYPTLAPSIAETMKEDLRRRFDIPVGDIIVVDEGGNTVSDDEQIIEVMQREGFQSAIDISSGYHKVAKSLSGKRGNRFVSAEEILKKRHPLYRGIISDVYKSRPIRRLIANQCIGVLILNIPRHGREFYEERSESLRLGKGPEGGAEVTVFDPDSLRRMTGKDQEPVVK